MDRISRVYLEKRHRRLKALLAEVKAKIAVAESEQRALLAAQAKTTEAQIAAVQILDLPDDLTDARVENLETEKP